jgi:hypothetical protein
LRQTRRRYREIASVANTATIAAIQIMGQQPERAAVLLGAAEAIRRRAGTPLPLRERVDVDRATNAAVGALGREAFTRAREQGLSTSIEVAADFALSGGVRPS